MTSDYKCHVCVKTELSKLSEQCRNAASCFFIYLDMGFDVDAVIHRCETHRYLVSKTLAREISLDEYEVMKVLSV